MFEKRIDWKNNSNNNSSNDKDQQTVTASACSSTLEPFFYNDSYLLPADNHNKENNTPQNRIATAAGVGTGALGMLVGGGPLGAVVLGFSAAFAAEKKEGVVGDSARAVGELALSAQKLATEIDDKHHVVDKTLLVAGEAWNKAKELDREHKIVEQARDVAIYGSTATVNFVRRHNLVQRGAHGLVKGASWISERVVAGSLSLDHEDSSNKLSMGERKTYSRRLSSS